MLRGRRKDGENTHTTPTTPTKRKKRARSLDTLQLAAGTSSDGEVVGVGGTAAVYGKKLQKPKIDCSSALFSKIKATDHFVDKTKIIEELFNDTEYILITRPRRFGKSTIMNMVEEFVEKKVYTTGDKAGQEILRSTENDRAFPEMNLRLFEDGNFEISKWNEFSRHRGKYPTIHLDFQLISADDYLGILLGFRSAIRKAFMQHEYLLWSTEKQLDRFDKEQFEKYLYPKPTEEAILDMIVSCPDIEKTEKALDRLLSNHITEALPFLARVLHQHYNHEIYLFIDEYDAPINNTLFKSKDLCEKVNGLLTLFFIALLKGGKNFIARALITGISYMSSVGLSGVNNVKKHMFLRGAPGSDDRYEVFYGITEQELEQLTTKFTEKFWQGVNKLPKEKVESYYNGYQSIGQKRVKIYPIWSIVNALENGELGNYWELSGIMAGARQGLNIPIVLIAIEKLLSGRHIKCEIPYKLELNHLHDLSDVILKWEEKRTLLKPDVFVSFLMQQGYLTYEKNIAEDIYEVKIPNTLIKNEFRNMIKTYVGSDYDLLITRVTAAFDEFPDDPDDLSDEMVKRVISSVQEVFEHVSEKWNQRNEDAYHCVIFHCLCKSSKYMCCSELTGKKGRLDIAFNSENIAIIIEVKHCQSALKAFNQIESKRYVEIFRKHLSNENLKCVCMGLDVNKNNKVSIAYKNADKSGSPCVISLKN